MKQRLWLTAFGFCLLTAPPAFADPRLDEIVYQPYVETHEAELEFRNGAEMGGPLGGAQTTVVEAEYGFNDRFSLSFVGAHEGEPGDGSRWRSVGLESVFYLGPIPKLGVDAGLYLEYNKGLSGELDRGEAKLLLAKNVGRFQGLFNFIVERPFGAPRGQEIASYGYAASATWRTVGHVRVGVEAFGDLGDDHCFGCRQGAYIGPQLTWNPKIPHTPYEIGLDAGWLAAAGDDRKEGRSQARLNLEIERRF
jgi:hypothetical protein